jgi:hypothetical protein
LREVNYLGDYLLDASTVIYYRRLVNELLSWIPVVTLAIGFIALAFNALQVISSSDEFRIAKLWFLAAALTLLAGLIIWGITTNLSLTLRLIVCFVACVAIVIAAIEAVRYVNRKSNLWIRSRQTVNESAGVRGSDEESEESDSTFVCLNTRTAELELMRGFCTEHTSEKNIRAPLVAFGNIGNKASMKNEVKARITFYDSDGKYLQHINNGVWLEREEISIEFFDVGMVLELVIALMPLDGQENDKAYAFDTQVMREIKPVGKECRVEVSLIGGIFPATVGIFNFRLTLEPELAIEEIREG